jgi:hypothetical protein
MRSVSDDLRQYAGHHATGSVASSSHLYAHNRLDLYDMLFRYHDHVATAREMVARVSATCCGAHLTAPAAIG